MTIKTTMIALVAGTAIFSACNDRVGGENAFDGTLKNETDSISYALGVLQGNSYKGSGMEELNEQALAGGAKGMMDGDSNMLMTIEEAGEMANAYFSKLQKAKSEAEFGQAKAEAAAFLEENKTKEGVMVTPSGLQYKILVEGTGAKPTTSDIVKVHYTGKLIDGTTFDSSVDRGEPIEFPVNGVIPGWTEALQMMPVGSKWMLYIPYDIAYGERGAGQVIPPYSTLIFEVELLEIKPNDAK